MDKMGGILTNGLGSTACNSLIYGPFRLKCYVARVGHGSAQHVRPGSKVESIVKDRLATIHKNTEQQRIEQQFELARRRADDELDERNAAILNKRSITIVVGLNDKLIQKELVVDKKRADKIVKAINMINTTTRKITFGVEAFKRYVGNITATFKR